ncbi:MAG: nitroreductase family protein [Acidimicrobiales bacterium]
MHHEPRTFDEIVHSTPTCRFYRSDPVADDQLVRILDAARFAPQGGNRQPVHFVVVAERATKETLRDWYLEPWRTYMANVESGAQTVGGEKARQSVLDADHMARHLADAPILIVVCADLAALHATDTNLDRLSIVGGASVYPAVQNLLLAARAEGLGAALTTLLAAYEPQIKALLGIPDGIAVAAVVVLGHPERPLPTKLSRRPLTETAFGERWGRPLDALTHGNADQNQASES